MSELTNSSDFSCTFSDILNLGYIKTHHIFATFMKSRGKRFANIIENETNANKTSSTVYINCSAVDIVKISDNDTQIDRETFIFKTQWICHTRGLFAKSV